MTATALLQPTTATDQRTRAAGLRTLIGGTIGAIGATATAFVPPAVAPELTSYPYTPGVFIVTEVVWTLAHVLILTGVLAIAGARLAGPTRLARVGPTRPGRGGCRRAPRAGRACGRRC